MTKRDFFILIIKVFGLLSLITSLFSALPSNIAFAMTDIDASSILLILISASVLVGLFIVLIFKADKVVELLKLDRGFDNEKIEIGNLKPTDIIKMGTFIIGGLLLLDNIPAFLGHSIFAFKGNINGVVYESQDKFYWAVSGLNIIIGILLVTNYQFVAKKLVTEKE